MVRNSKRTPGPRPGAERDANLDHASQANQVAAPVSELYGVAPVLEALRAGRRTIETVTIADGVGHHRLNELIALARKQGIPVRQAPRAALDRATSNANHQGVVARVSAARYTEAGALLDQLQTSSNKDDPALVVVLDGVVDPRNFGAILRTAECAGVDGVFIPERRAVGLTETVAKAAAGALEHLPVARVVNLARLIDEFKERNIWTVGTSGEAEMDYAAWDWTTPTAVFFGGEGAGLHRLVRERCDALVSIPIRGQIESLNVSVAAGIILYEALRQRAAARATAGDGRRDRLARSGPGHE